MKLHEIEKFFTPTKYIKWYFLLITKSLSTKRKKYIDNTYYEEHHILPVAIFNKYSNLNHFKWNRVLFTAREHYIAHFLLYKHYKSIKDKNGTRSSLLAVYCMSGRFKINSHAFKSLRKNNICFSLSHEQIHDFITKAKTLSTKELAQEFNLRCNYAQFLCRKLELSPPRKDIRTIKLDKNLLNLYIKDNLTINQIADKFGVAFNTVKTNLEMYNLTPIKTRKIELNINILKKLVREDHYTMGMLVEEFDVSEDTVRRHMKENNIIWSKSKPHKRHIIKEEELKDFLMENYNVQAAARYFNVSRDIIQKNVDSYNIRKD